MRSGSNRCEEKEEKITYARAKDVTDVVQQHVQLLSDHKIFNFPPNTLLLQTQSDKGGDSTKLCIQLLNRHVNSVHHLIPVAMYEGVDENYDAAAHLQASDSIQRSDIIPNNINMYKFYFF